MARLDFDLDDLTQAGLKRLVKQLLAASDEEEKEIIAKLSKDEKSPKKEKNDLADLDEEMHGRPNTPLVTEDDLPSDDMPDVPKKKRKA
jgi:hypothetical protein